MSFLPKLAEVQAVEAGLRLSPLTHYEWLRQTLKHDFKKQKAEGLLLTGSVVMRLRLSRRVSIDGSTRQRRTDWGFGVDPENRSSDVASWAASTVVQRFVVQQALGITNRGDADAGLSWRQAARLYMYLEASRALTPEQQHTLLPRL